MNVVTHTAALNLLKVNCSAKRTKECEEAAIGEEQAACVYQAGNPALVNRSDWIQTSLL